MTSGPIVKPAKNSGCEHHRVYTSPEAAAFLRIPLATLYKWQTIGVGPRKRRVGRYCHYLLADLLAFLDDCAED